MEKGARIITGDFSGQAQYCVSALVLKRIPNAVLPCFQFCKQPVSIHQDRERSHHVVSTNGPSVRNTISAEYTVFSFQVYKIRKRQQSLTLKSWDVEAMLPGS